MATNILDRFKETIEEKITSASDKKIKVGIIGTGWIAEAHVANYLKCDDVEIVAAADLVPGKAEKFCKDNGIEGVRLYPDHKSMIDAEELDAVSVCTYNRTHAECTIYALQHGVNVLLEKPMCVTLEEAVEICKAEKASGKILSIGFQPRFDANMKMLKKVVQSGELGDIYYIQTGGGRRRGIPTPYGTSFIDEKTAGL
ncbi:MAG: Gfo/Idh/MocA family oxidoreductase, partial [Clostridia bacterium]|nr:Gfo/Idh/MocA family oxidoreductase [Clostridia bacterium]